MPKNGPNYSRNPPIHISAFGNFLTVKKRDVFLRENNNNNVITNKEDVQFLFDTEHLEVAEIKTNRLNITSCTFYYWSLPF